jgi:Domain of unknown function (DUF5060)
MRAARMKSLTFSLLLTLACLVRAEAAPRITVVGTEPAQKVQRFGRFDISFQVHQTRATFLHWPYDQAPPHGVPAGVGITVNGVFVDPGGRTFTQPAFYYQQFRDEIRNGRDWHYPTTDFVWKVRFSPNQVGAWKYRIVIQDQDGTAETPWQTFTVEPSANHGFVRVSQADSRYFEFEDGTFFSGLGFQFPEYLEDPTTKGAPEFRQLGAYGINFVRLWISSLYGSAWNPYVGGRNHYSGYLPVTGLAPFRDEMSGETTLAMRIDYEPGGDTGWFDACRLEWANNPEPVKPNTRYRVRATYRGRGISGPRNRRSPNFGFVVKLGGMFPNCYEPATSRPVSTYGLNNSAWGSVEGTWNSGNRSFLPKLHLALENVTQGEAYVQSVSLREMLPDGGEGPEILVKPSMQHQLYIPQAKAYAFDKIVEQAERNGVYLKLVVMDKGDKIYLKMDDNGEFVTARDNQDGVYGTGRTSNKTRWLQQAWWRYLQARWGYSPNVHSWELVNEGDPASTAHYELADEFGKFMHYQVFGAKPEPSFNHPNDHLVTTSFWHSFPAAAFWASKMYPNVDYADVHAYVSTSFAPPAEKQKMQWDAAYYHTWHSSAAAAARIGKPVVRGEAGMDIPGRQDEGALGLQRDQTGIWLHNFLWAGLDAGGLYELYWWRSHIWSERRDHRSSYRLVNLFLSGLDLNKGGFSDWSGKVSNPALRVVGQKNVKAGSMHLWIQNARHEWKNVADGQIIEPVSGELSVAGFRPGAVYELEWWDTYAQEKTILSSQDVTAAASGELKIGVKSLQTDVALKVRLKTNRRSGNV